MIEITLNNHTPIDFFPSGRNAEITQNVRTIMSTLQGSVPYDRGFGIDSTIIDEPIPVAKARLSTELIISIEDKEPRVFVSEIDFVEDHLNGRLQPIVRVEIREEEVTGG